MIKRRWIRVRELILRSLFGCEWPFTIVFVLSKMGSRLDDVLREESLNYVDKWTKKVNGIPNICNKPLFVVYLQKWTPFFERLCAMNNVLN